MTPGVKLADIARKHGVTRWQIYEWRKQMRQGNLLAPESVAALPMFAELFVKGATSDAPPPGSRSDLEIIVGDIVIRKRCYAPTFSLSALRSIVGAFGASTYDDAK
jgi:transposase